MIPRLSADPVLADKYAREGYVVLPFLTEAETTALREEFEALSTDCATGFYTSLWSRDVVHRQRVHDMVQRATQAKARELLGDFTMCLGNFAVKQPGAGDSTCPIHQDWTFVDETRFQTVNLWIPMIDVDSTNGCLAVVPGSHRATNRLRANYSLEHNYLPFTPVLSILNEQYLMDVPLSAGSVIAYHPGLLHGSKPNRSGRSRAAAVAVYIPSQAPLLHCFQPSPETIDVYEVDRDFYWREVTLGSPPTAARKVSVESGVVDWIDESRLREVCGQGNLRG